MSIQLVKESVHLTVNVGISKTLPLATMSEQAHACWKLRNWSPSTWLVCGHFIQIYSCMVFVSHACMYTNNFEHIYKWFGTFCRDESLLMRVLYNNNHELWSLWVIILLNCILNHGDIATCNFYFSVSDYKVCTLLLQTISCQVWLCTTTSVNSLIAVVHYTRKSFLTTEHWFKFTPAKRRLTTSHLPVLEPVLKRALPSYTICSNSLPLPTPGILWASPRALRGSAIHIFLVHCILPINWEQSLRFTRFNIKNDLISFVLIVYLIALLINFLFAQYCLDDHWASHKFLVVITLSSYSFSISTIPSSEEMKLQTDP